ncbi:MAG: MerR family transcriptional regulator [Myxococcales bacterium]|nr:MerR family transcriptional regulator [Myxococcales bacterium]
MARDHTHQVKEVARIAGVSVRTLHHYDEIGLLVPSSRTRAGHRSYTTDDLLRLQQILIRRELGMPLREIKRSLDDPAFDWRIALQRQRTQLAERAERTASMLRAVDAALAALPTEGETMKEMTPAQITDLFDGFDPSRHDAETHQRWGDADAYRESARRTSGYTRADWDRYKAEAHDIMSAAAQLLQAGAPTDGDEARAVAERHRLLIDRWFFPCSPVLHTGLADLYEGDVRFGQNLDTYGQGLATWLAAAIRANAGG